MKKILFLLFVSASLFGIEPEDQEAIQNIIHAYTYSWNNHEGVGFADGFTSDADFVNIFGMHFQGREAIEKRHQEILQTFLKNTHLEILQLEMREVNPCLIIAHVYWNLEGPEILSFPIKHGLFTQVFIKNEGTWSITSSHNTLIPSGC